MSLRRLSIRAFWCIQLAFVVVFAVSYAGMSLDGKNKLRVAVHLEEVYPEIDVPREKPWMITPLYNDPNIISDEELAAVLKRVRPRFFPKQLKSNYVEHAIRMWGVDATFQDPRVMSGRQMLDYLTDYGKQLASWGDDVEPMFKDVPHGIQVEWGRKQGVSVHHDHWLACLTESGVSLNEPIFTPGDRAHQTIKDVLRQAMYDFRIDERETDWSVMSFGSWLPPQKSWPVAEGRQVSFDILADRLMRGHLRYGTCAGTHRVFSLMALLRIDDEYDIVSDEIRARIIERLKEVRDCLMECQYEDGHWPYDWWNGAEAITHPEEHPEYRKVIATGHHIEYFSVAPKELHVPHDQILKAARWAIKKTIEAPDEEIFDNYTFYTHVANGLSWWRQVSPGTFWKEWQKTHPYVPDDKEPLFLTSGRSREESGEKEPSAAPSEDLDPDDR